MMRLHYTKMANEYVKDVLTGKIEADTDLKEACERHKHRLEKKDSGKTFDHQEVERVGWFLKNIGVDVTPYHCFMAATVFGWKEGNKNA